MSEREPQPVVVVDAGVGNLGNQRRALAHLGVRPIVSDDPATVAAARRLVLPGVGAFAPPRERLRGALEEAIRAALDGGAYLLGICVGYQILFEAGEEFGVTDGLGLLPGRVTALPDSVPLPHIGWNRLEVENSAVTGDLAPLLAGLPEEPWVYYVHSFAPEGVPEELVLARTLHGRRFPAVVGRGRVMGMQFHPEKSGATGLALLANFLRLGSGAGEEAAA
ncbi:MAG TPA: imidazole glycerol phosphate synthase subunit HisH [Thermoanaerobaculia bacterium]|nr:imidazole glycerol phosphate synthase subunit HisH [Thermoanaerobaculia bacterium]